MALELRANAAKRAAALRLRARLFLNFRSTFTVYSSMGLIAVQAPIYWTFAS